MKSSKCTHIRIRDDNDYSANVEDVIREIEKKFNIDLRSLHQWQNLVKRLHVAKTDCSRQIQCANLRKSKIIEKLYIEWTRPSPFQLNDVLARTAAKWRDLGRPKITSVPPLALNAVIVEEEGGEEEHVAENVVLNEEIDALHPNTEISSAYHATTEPIKMNAQVQYNLGSANQTTTSLPVFICTNTHKLISPLDSKISSLSYNSLPHDERVAEAAVITFEPSTTAVLCSPTPIRIVQKTLKQQTLLFSLINCKSEYLHVRFKNVTNRSPFKKIKILPNIPKRLYPGIAVVFKLIFKLESLKEFKTSLYFRIGHDVYTNASVESLFVPVLFESDLHVTISETVNIPPVYPWHIKMGPERDYPRGVVEICTDEPFTYHLHIHKRSFVLCDEYMTSTKPVSLNTEIFKECDSLSPSSRLGSKQSLKMEEVTDTAAEANTAVTTEVVSENSTEMIFFIVDYIVQLALEVFIFDCTYSFLDPHSKISIPVYLTKVEHTGYHHSYFDVDLIDSETETVVMKKTIKVFAEVLPHPIKIAPILLDMSHSPISHGFFQDQFVITNVHKLYSADVYIKLTTKMKKIFNVSPMKCVVPAQSSSRFEVKFCSRDCLLPEPSEDLVHFTFKIIIDGNKVVYRNIPPIFYELIAPCAMEFKRVYNEKYFKETE